MSPCSPATAASAVPVRLDARRPGQREAGAPLVGPLVDRFGRVHTDLRLSVTDRCNLRCQYCLPDEEVAWMAADDILTADEVVRVASVARSLGVRTLRLTGGEPLVRARLPGLVARLSAIGFEDLSLTTNGTRLSRLAAELAGAGLRRVNVSCDSLRRRRFARITGRDALDRVLAGMDAAEAAGLQPLKVNVVVMAGVNDDEAVDFARFARATGRVVRFIEYMPLDAAGAWERRLVVPGAELVRRINRRWPLEPVATCAADRGSSPAERYRFADGGGEIGVITSVSQPFCGSCDRIRVTADGALRNCLFATEEWSLRAAMRAGASDADLELVFRRAVWGKQPGHGIDEPAFLRPARSMSQIGG